jgi:AcrR family transcriptional regulator
MKHNSFAIAAVRRAGGPSKARERLISAVRRLLQSHDPSGITTSVVLREAGVARNTLYLHFENHAQLLETALLSIFSAAVQENIDSVEQALRKSKTRSEFFRKVAVVIRDSNSRNRRKFRIERCRLIVHAENNDGFAAVMAAEQSRINAQFTELLEQCRQRGWIRGSVKSSVAAVLVQALTLGKVIDDISGKKLSEDDWFDMYLEVVNKVIMGS